MMYSISISLYSIFIFDTTTRGGVSKKAREIKAVNDQLGRM